MKPRTAVVQALALLALVVVPLHAAFAEASEVRLAQQFSMGYMQFSIMDR